MKRKNYTLQDIYDYLLEYYGYDWKLFLICDYDTERRVQKTDFSGDYRTNLNVTALLYKGGNRNRVFINVSNQNLKVWNGQPIKPLVEWSDYLVLKHKEDKMLKGY